MGKTLVREISKQPDMKLVAAIDAPQTSFAGRDAGEVAGAIKLGVPVVGAEEMENVLGQAKPDVLVDFTKADAAVQNVEKAASLRIPVVVGTTGFSKEQLARIRETVVEAKIPAIVAPNMSIGMNVLYKLAEDAARLLGRDYDVEIIEAHRAGKADIPSGTAKKLAEVVAREWGMEERTIKCGRSDREPIREKGEIRIHSIRAGDVVGEHTIVFCTQGERVELIHRAHGREAFAAGALQAIRYVVEKGEPGVIQDMRNVLSV
jgi:4-hydroxy-tetrahydrodipicolinate reductase